MNKLYFGMYEKSELQVYAELNKDFECKKYLLGIPNLGSFYSDLGEVPMD